MLAGSAGKEPDGGSNTMKPHDEFEISVASRKTIGAAAVLAAISLGCFAPPAFAYLDPSTGSMILSAIVGIFATLGLALKTYWYKFKSFFGRGNQEQATAPSEEREASQSDAG